jgi:hypothetical protein
MLLLQHRHLSAVTLPMGLTAAAFGWRQCCLLLVRHSLTLLLLLLLLLCCRLRQRASWPCVLRGAPL